MGFSTDAIHVGQEPDPSTGAVVVPIYQTSIFALQEIGKSRGYEYSRSANPTRAALEKCLAALERGTHGFAFASGVAATHAVLSLLKPGEHVVAGASIYGGTYRLLERVMKDAGLEVTYVDTTATPAIEAAFRPATRMLLVETPSNPLLEVSDLAACAAVARRRGAWMAVDNTFMTPFYQRPLDRGAHIVIHSATKYLNGHSDGIGGAVIVQEAELAERLSLIQTAAGAILGPFDSWLVLRGIKTLSVRMSRHSENARAVAEFLTRHPKVPQVFYPGLPAHPGHALAQRQMDGFGGIVSFATGSLANAKKLCRAVKVFTLAGSLGGVESILSHPATMSHSALPPALRRRLGVADGLLRLSVGMEDLDDLLADLSQALDRF